MPVQMRISITQTFIVYFLGMESVFYSFCNQNHFLHELRRKLFIEVKQFLTIRMDAKQNTYNYLYDYTQELKTVCSRLNTAK